MGISCSDIIQVKRRFRLGDNIVEKTYEDGVVCQFFISYLGGNVCCLVMNEDEGDSFTIAKSLEDLLKTPDEVIVTMVKDVIEDLQPGHSFIMVAKD